MSTTRKSMPMMPFFVDSYIAATRQMTLAEKGAYTDLLFAQWNIGPLPKGQAQLAKLVGATAREFANVWPGIKEKFVETRAGLVNERLEKHRTKAVRLSERHRLGADKTNGRRWGGRSQGESLSESESVSLSDGNGVAERVASISISSDAYQEGH